jgi:hypothetical protein
MQTRSHARAVAITVQVRIWATAGDCVHIARFLFGVGLQDAQASMRALAARATPCSRFHHAEASKQMSCRSGAVDPFYRLPEAVDAHQQNIDDRSGVDDAGRYLFGIVALRRPDLPILVGCCISHIGRVDSVSSCVAWNGDTDRIQR